MSSQLIEYPLVADPGSLDSVISRLGDAPLVAIDTEFIRERTYYPELCVLQVATGEFVAAIDCLADTNLVPLYDALLANGKPWVLHSARQDLEVLAHRFGSLPATLIDTQLAAALLGYPLQIGLQGLVSDVLGIALGKEHTRADWSRRPLAEAILRYALDDVRFLLPAWRELEQQLEKKDRLSWFSEDCRRLLDTGFEADPAAIFERTKGAGVLRGRHHAAALALIAWREDRAIQRNKPRRWILADDQLVAIASALPQDRQALAGIAGLPAKFLTRSGAAVLNAIRAAAEIPPAPDQPPPDRAAVKSLQSDIRLLAAELGVQPELIATRKDVAQAAAGRLPAAFTEGWRASVLAAVTSRLSADQAS